MSVAVGMKNQVDTIAKLYLLEKNKEGFRRAASLKIVAYDNIGRQLASFDIKQIDNVKALIINEIDSEIKDINKERNNHAKTFME